MIEYLSKQLYSCYLELQFKVIHLCWFNTVLLFIQEEQFQHFITKFQSQRSFLEVSIHVSQLWEEYFTNLLLPIANFIII